MSDLLNDIRIAESFAAVLEERPHDIRRGRAAELQGPASARLGPSWMRSWTRSSRARTSGTHCSVSSVPSQRPHRSSATARLCLYQTVPSRPWPAVGRKEPRRHEPVP